jgi:uncharacterized protein (DUF2147 family)
MKRLFAIAALLLASSAAQAGDSYSFEIGGRTIHIDAPNGCDSPSCVSVSIPGVYESGPKRGKSLRNSQPEPQAKADPQPRPAPQARVEPQAPAPAVDPAPARVEQAPDPAPAPTSTVARTDLAPAAAPQPDAAPTPAPGPVVATAPVSAPVQRQQAPTAAPSRPGSSPLGMWQTEEKEGMVRIEACGANLCGYSVDAKTNENGEKVLINMKPGSDKWTGRIHDPKSGSNYDSTIALKGSDRLRVQGCAFGGMFCGGQTWTRLN